MGRLTLALTAEEYQSLVNAGLAEFFADNKPRFQDMAEAAYRYTKRFVAAAELPVRVDDVIKALEPALRVTPLLSTYLAGRKLTQQYWYKRFGDLILDDLWTELIKL